MLGELRRQDGSLINAWKTLLDKWKTIRRHLIDAATATTAVTVSLRAGSRLDFGQRGVTVA